MLLHYGFDSFPHDVATVVTVGSFDGVHSGHNVLLDRVKAVAARLSAESVVVTFDPHPRIAMGRAEGMGLLTTVEERALLLERVGIDHVVVARFDERFRSQSFEHFVRESLVGRLGMRGLVVGYNHRLGRGNEGRYETLQPLAQELGFALERVEQHLASGDKVSSTVVRGEIALGRVERASQLLGHPYIILGDACNGVFTLSDSYKLLPADGEYAVELISADNTRSIRTTISVASGRITLPDAIDGRYIITISDK